MFVIGWEGSVFVLRGMLWHGMKCTAEHERVAGKRERILGISTGRFMEERQRDDTFDGIHFVMPGEFFLFFLGGSS